MTDYHLIASEWVEHGYPVSKTFETVEPCIIDGAPQNTCTHSGHNPNEHLSHMPNPEDI